MSGVTIIGGFSLVVIIPFAIEIRVVIGGKVLRFPHILLVIWTHITVSLRCRVLLVISFLIIKMFLRLLKKSIT